MSQPPGVAALQELIGRVSGVHGTILQFGDPAHLAGDPAGLQSLAGEHRSAANALRTLQERGQYQVGTVVGSGGSWYGGASQAFAGYWGGVHLQLGDLASRHDRTAAILEEIAADSSRLNGDVLAVVHRLGSWLDSARVAVGRLDAGAVGGLLAEGGAVLASAQKLLADVETFAAGLVHRFTVDLDFRGRPIQVVTVPPPLRPPPVQLPPLLRPPFGGPLPKPKPPEGIPLPSGTRGPGPIDMPLPGGRRDPGPLDGPEPGGLRGPGPIDMPPPGGRGPGPIDLPLPGSGRGPGPVTLPFPGAALGGAVVAAAKGGQKGGGKGGQGQGGGKGGQGQGRGGQKPKPQPGQGPSGKPKIHIKRHPTVKRAKDAARNEGKRAPVKHPSPKRGDPHFHPTDETGRKIPGGTHQVYPHR